MPIILRPTTTGSLTVVYTTLANIQRILMTNPQRRVRFSGSFKDLRLGDNNAGDIDLAPSAINMDDDYAGTNRKVEITFTSVTEFTVTMTDDESRSQLSRGTGNTSTNFTSSGGEFTIAASGWSGSAQSGDIVSFMTDSHMSNNTGLWFIQRAEQAIDSKIGSIGGAYKDLDTTNQRIFTSTTVPEIIASATTFMAAYLIWCVVNSGVAAQSGDEIVPSSISLWRKLAEQWVNEWMSREIERVCKTSPTFTTRASLFSFVGLEDIGLGRLAMEEEPTLVMPEDRDDWGDDELEFG